MNRAGLLLAGCAALLPVAVTLHAAPPAQTPLPAFTPPQGRQILTRTVTRELPGGAAIVVRRSYAVEFRRAGTGFIVDGELIDTAVDVPAALVPLGELERRRGDPGMFPLQLDRQGRIQPRALQGDSAAHAAGAGAAAAMLANGGLSAADAAGSRGFIDQIAATGALSAWPDDLFCAGRSRTEHRRLALPDGTDGAVEVSVVFAPGRRVERTVVSQLAGTRRTTRESWTIVPA